MEKSKLLLLEISQTLRKLDDFEEVKTQYKMTKKELKNLEREIEKLEKEKSKINTKEIDIEVSSAKVEYERLNEELEGLYKESGMEFTLEDIKEIIENTNSEEIVVQRLKNFIENKMVGTTLSRKYFEKIINRDIDGHLEKENMLRIILINKEVEELFYLVKDKIYYEEMVRYFQEKIKHLVNGVVAGNISLYADDKNLYWIYVPEEEKKYKLNRTCCGSNESTKKSILNRMVNWSFDNREKIEEDVYNDENYENIMKKKILNVEPSRSSLKKIAGSYQYISTPVIEILKENLKNNILNERPCIKFIMDNNRALEGTDGFIKNVNEWILDISMKLLFKLLNTDTDINEDLIANNNGTYITRSYSLFRNAIKLINDIESKRKEKAIRIMNNSVDKYFCIKKSMSLRSMFEKYSSVSDILKSGLDIVNIEGLLETRETLFYKIIEFGSSLDINWNESIIKINSHLQDNFNEFSELVLLFINHELVSFFYTEYFGFLYMNFVNSILKDINLSNDVQPSTIKSVGEYILGLSYKWDSSLISNYKRIKDIIDILDSNINQIKYKYDEGNICLEKSEIKILIELFFADNYEKKEFLERLQ